MRRNYFKAAGELYFFANHDEDDTARAFVAAQLFGNDIAVFETPVWRGPWDSCQIVGHRRPRDIVVDLAYENDPTVSALLMLELKSVPTTSFVVEA